MKTILYYFILYYACSLITQPLQAQSNIDLSDKQILGYTLFGLGFTTVAYTYSGYNDLPNDSNQRMLFYSIGTGMAITGVIILISGPKKKTKQKLWSGLSIAKISPSPYEYKKYFYKK